MKRILWLLAMPLMAADRAELPAELTLKQALDIALHNSTALRRAAAQVQQAEGQAGQSHSQLLPQLNVQATDTGQTVNLHAMGINIPSNPLFNFPFKVGPFQTVDARAGLTQNVLNLAILDRDRAARQQSRAVASLADNARDLLALQVSTAFAQAVRAQVSVRTLERQVELATQLDRITRDRLEAGVASRLEATRSRQQVNNLAQSLEESRNTYTVTKLQLANVLHARITADFRVSEDTQASPETAPDTVTRALESRADYRSAQQRIKAAELQLSATRRQRWPVVQFRADYGQSGTSPIANLNTFHVQGAISVPVYTGGRIEAEITEAEGKLAEARANADEIRAQVETDVLSALAAMEAARKQLDIAQAAVRLAGEELDLARARFEGGVADNTEVVNAQDRISRAEDNVVRAGYNRDLAIAQLRRAMGAGGQQ